MTPAICRVKHDPPNSYGDCLRACVATVMNIDADQVPHFHHDGPSGDVARQRVRDWLRPLGYTITGFAMAGKPDWIDADCPNCDMTFSQQTEYATVDEILAWMGEQNPDTTWLLLGSTGEHGGDHVNVCQGGRVVHDPAWIPTSIKTVGSSGFWEIWVVSKL